MNKTLGRFLFALLGLAALGGAGIGVRALFFGKKPPPSFDTTPVERGHIAAKVTATGTLSALVTVQVGAQVSGRISELNADFNSDGEEGRAHRRDRPAALRGGRRAGAGQRDAGRGAASPSRERNAANAEAPARARQRPLTKQRSSRSRISTPPTRERRRGARPTSVLRRRNLEQAERAAPPGAR